MSALRTKPYTFGTVAPTPLPWRAESNPVESNALIFGTGRKRGQHKQHVAVVWSGSDATLEVAEANAELIVRAVNSHAALIYAADALRELVRTVGPMRGSAESMLAYKRAVAALALVPA